MQNILQKNTKKKLLKLISDFDKVRKYKVNIKISIIFLYNNNEPLETKIKRQ